MKTQARTIASINTNSQQLKILMSAYACEPGRGSEPGVGWNTVQEIARDHQVWVLTSNTHRLAIEAELARRPISNLHIVYLDPFNWVYDWAIEGKRAHWDVHLHYYLWQVWAYFVAKELHRTVGFDLTHHVTYVKYSCPSFLTLLPIPFLWGPVGGGESAPRAFWKNLGLRAQLYEILRNLARHVGELDPFVQFTARRSMLTLATTIDTAVCLKRIGSRNVKVFSQLGLNQDELELLTNCFTPSQSPVKFISIGRLLHWKGFHLGLQAFAQADLSNSAEYWIIGEGPEHQALQALAEELGIADKVKFWHKLSRGETFKRLGESFALIHPSLHDSGGLVCLEAMAAGCPVICLDLGGPATQVTEARGFKIPAHNPEQVVQDIASAMIRLTSDPTLRATMGEAGWRYANEFCSWQTRGRAISKLYKESLIKYSDVNRIQRFPST